MRPIKIISYSLFIMIIVAVAIIIIEVRLRTTHPYSAFQVGSELRWMRHNKADLSKVFTVDHDFGFRPILGSDLYNKYGTIKNNYSLEKQPGVTRLLFIGDSITARGKIIDALKQVYGEDTFEYWNAGVESFNTVQEVNYYNKYNSVIRPDHVILTFVHNDIGSTPIAFMNKDNKLVVYALNKPLQNLNPWLFKHSYLYRFLVGVSMSTAKDKELINALKNETRKSLVELRDLLSRDGIILSVIFLPKLKPSEKWKPYELDQRAEIMQMLEDLAIRYFDLFEVSDKAIKQGIRAGESKRDHWHPSAEISKCFAESLYQNGLFQTGTKTIE